MITQLWGNNPDQMLLLHPSTAIMYILKVLCGVLYPEMHNNGIQKKKKKKL